MLNVKVLYEPGKKNVIADALSRLKTKNDELVATITSEMNENNLLSSFKDKFVIINGEKFFKDDGKLRKVIYNEKERIKLILSAHKIGHEGVFETYNRLKEIIIGPI